MGNGNGRQNGRALSFLSYAAALQLSQALNEHNLEKVESILKQQNPDSVRVASASSADCQQGDRSNSLKCVLLGLLSGEENKGISLQVLNVGVPSGIGYKGHGTISPFPDVMSYNADFINAVRKLLQREAA